MSVWERGYVTIEVTQKHIDESMENDSSHCMTAEAIKEAVPNAKFVSVDLQSIRWTDVKKGLRYLFLTPRIAQFNIQAYDQGDRENVAPYTLHMKPAQIFKIGKKQQHRVPDAAQLKELGLKLAPQDQADLNRAAEIVTQAEIGGESLLAGAPQRRKRPGLTRRRVAAAKSNGTAPTVLGGKPPGFSILARREFGLRQLQKHGHLKGHDGETR